MKQVYCISGLGADERIFNRLHIPGVELHYLPWLIPAKRENIKDYSARMQAGIQHDNPILVGVSFGGMMAIEISKHIPVKKVILISSAKSFKEIPKWMRLSGRMGLNKLLPTRPGKWAHHIENSFLDVQTEEELLLSNEFREKVNPVYLHWAIRQVVNWRNDWQPSSVYHIHGTRDKIFPIRNIRNAHFISGAGHFMIMNRAPEISSILESIID